MTTYLPAPSSHPVPAVKSCIDAVKSALAGDQASIPQLRGWLKEINVRALVDLTEEQAVAFEKRLKESTPRQHIDNF